MVPEFLKNENTIFHFTSALTAIEYILPNKNLLFSPRKNSDDPVESKKIIISKSIAIIDSNIEERTEGKSQELYDLIDDRIKNNKQICFCTNKFCTSESEYGYQKSRMWDQYGDNFKGVCLAFDQPLLLQNCTSEIIKGEINYLSYDDLRKDYLEVDSNHLDNYDSQYENSLLEKSNHLLFRKHIDYRDECEFRICNFGKPDYLNIGKSLLGIIVCDNIMSTSNFGKLKHICRVLNIPLIYCTIDSCGFKLGVEPNGDIEKHFQIFRTPIPDYTTSKVSILKNRG
ncbi:MAG: DUF2971 domain-containing protein [Aequorivita sp.]|nr:DUF2971 domain-containing protein [Aequorivita sp.]